MENPYQSNFRIITAIFQVSEYLGVLRYLDSSNGCITDKIFGCRSLVSWEAPFLKASRISSLSRLDIFSNVLFSKRKIAASYHSRSKNILELEFVFYTKTDVVSPYLYEVSSRHLERFSSYRADTTL